MDSVHNGGGVLGRVHFYIWQIYIFSAKSDFRTAKHPFLSSDKKTYFYQQTKYLGHLTAPPPTLVRNATNKLIFLTSLFRALLKINDLIQKYVHICNGF